MNLIKKFSSPQSLGPQLRLSRVSFFPHTFVTKGTVEPLQLDVLFLNVIKKRVFFRNEKTDETSKQQKKKESVVVFEFVVRLKTCTSKKCKIVFQSVITTKSILLTSCIPTRCRKTVPSHINLYHLIFFSESHHCTEDDALNSFTYVTLLSNKYT